MKTIKVEVDVPEDIYECINYVDMEYLDDMFYDINGIEEHWALRAIKEGINKKEGKNE